MNREAVQGEGSIMNTAVGDARSLLQTRRDIRDIYWQDGLHIRVIKATQEVKREILHLLSPKLQSVTIKFDSVIPPDDIESMIEALPSEKQPLASGTAEMSTVDTAEMKVVNVDPIQ